MSIQIQGYGGVAADVGGTGYRALKVQCMPYEFGSNGSFKKSLATGTMAAGLAGAAPIFSFRWTSTTLLAVITKIVLDGFGSLTGFTAGQALLILKIARGFSVVDSGGTAGALTAAMTKLRTSMANTQLGDVRISSTATLTPGTRTLDTDPIGQWMYSLPVTANANFMAQPAPLLDSTQDGHPVVLAANEGVVINATVPATGTWLSGVTICWSEVASF